MRWIFFVTFSMLISGGAWPTNGVELCDMRAQLFQNTSASLPMPRASFIRQTLNRLRSPQHESDTCGEELLTFLIERTPSEEHGVLATELGLREGAQRELLTDFGFLIIEGGRSFHSQREPQQLLSFFTALQSAFDVKSLSMGLRVMSFQERRPGGPNGTTSSYSPGTLKARRVARIFVGAGDALRDSIDNRNLLTTDQALMVMIHEVAHGLFENGESTHPHFSMSSGSAGYSGQPLLFSRLCHGADRAIGVESVLAFYYDLLDGHFFTEEEHRNLTNMFRPVSGDNSNLTRRIPTRMPTQKVRFYGINSYAEDWATSWEAYFYNSVELWQEGLSREAQGLGTGVRRRFSYLAKAFSYVEDGQTYTTVFDSTSGEVRAQRVPLVLDQNGDVQEVVLECREVSCLEIGQAEQGQALANGPE